MKLRQLLAFIEGLPLDTEVFFTANSSSLEAPHLELIEVGDRYSPLRHLTVTNRLDAEAAKFDNVRSAILIKESQ